MQRLKFLFILFILFFFLIIYRLAHWQIIESDKLGSAADLQSTRTLKIPARRGQILSSDGSYIVANKRAYLLYAEPKKLKNKEAVEKILSETLNIPISSISAKLQDDSRLWVPLAHKIGSLEKEILERKKLPGLGFEEEDMRYYPESSMAAHLLGFVGSDVNGDDKGYFGIEGYYNRQLEGRAGILRQETDARGLPILLGKSKRVEPENGRDLILNLDKSIQFIVEEKLKEGLEKYQAKGGWVVVMEPKTGAILAMASYPSYDPANFQNFDSTFYKNPVVAESYEPGSTFKSLIMASAINENKVKPQTEFTEDGPLQIGGYTIKTWNNEYSGKTTATGILERSSNVGMVKVGELLGKERLLEYIKNFGVGAYSNIDLEDEEVPDIRPTDKWYDIDYATATFGQGIALTAIQMLKAVGALANDGKMMEPHVVKAIINPDGKKIEIEPKVDKRLFSPETAHILSEMLVSAVDNGEARFAKPKGYRIAGKTGTAQIPIAGHYDSEKTIASFVGYAPASNPRFVMLTTLKEPSSSPWGSETAAPLFFTIAREIFKYYGIPPEN